MKKRKKKSNVLPIIFIVIIALIIILTKLNSHVIPSMNKIAIVPIKGAITQSTTEKIINQLNSAEKDSTVKGIILQINSPGGSAVSSKQMAEKVSSIEKPTTALIEEVGASGAYWVASAADTIVADPLSVTGSIGVAGSYLEFANLLQDYNITYQRLVGGRYKDTGSPYKELTEREREVLQAKIDIIHKYFIVSVSKNRDMDVGKFASGIFYLGAEAHKIGLVDHLGNKALAINLTKQAAGIEKAKLVTYKEKTSILSILNKLFSSFGFNVGKGISETYLDKQFQIYT